MKKVVIILVLLALIAGGGLGGAGMAGIGPLAGYVGPQPAGEEAAPVAAAAVPPRDIDLETIGVPLFAGDAVRSRLFLNVRVSVPAEMGEQIAQNAPRLQDAFLSDLLAYMPRHLRDRDKVELPVVQARLLRLARKVVGPANVADVTITHAFER